MKKLILNFLLIAAMFLGLSSCHHKDDFPPRNTFVLVHGAWQAAYVWDAVKAQLEKAGQTVVTVELPAHGEDFTSPAAVSMNVYRDKVIAALNKINGKVILVGHSMGGFVVSTVAEKVPSKIEKLVYIGAFVPANGQSLLGLSLTDKQSHLGPSLIPSKDQLTLDIIRSNVVDIFCADASKEVQQLVLNKFRVEPAIPFADTANITAANFGKVRKYYIHTLQDHAIGIDLQKQMVAAANITNVYDLNTSHCPFLSKPTEVTALLLKIAL